MVQRLRGRVRNNPAANKPQGKFTAPKHTKERKYIQIRDSDEKIIAKRVKEERELYKRLGYIELTTEKDIQEIFDHVNDDMVNNFYAKKGLFFVWKYSGFTVFLEDDAERDKFIDELNELQAAAIMNYINNNRVYEQNYLVAENGEIELTRKNQMCVRLDNGEIKFIAAGKTHSVPERRNITYEDLPITVMKDILKELKLDKPKK